MQINNGSVALFLLVEGQSCNFLRHRLISTTEISLSKAVLCKTDTIVYESDWERDKQS